MIKQAGDNRTFLEDLINPSVMADMISAKIAAKIRVLPFAKVDTTLQGRAGSTITIPQFTWSGEAEVVAEGEEIPIRALGTKSVNHTIKKIGIGGKITDEAILSGFGDPVGALNTSIANSIMSKCDNDAMEELLNAKTIFESTSEIAYVPVVDGIDLFGEEVNSAKATFIHPHQVSTLRKDKDFISADKYDNKVMINGEIGKIANSIVVASKKVKQVGGYFYNPIVRLNNDKETEDEIPALTYFLKRDVNVEKTRIARNRTTEITGDQHYVVALTNESNVVILKTLADLKTKEWGSNIYNYHGNEAIPVVANGVTTKAKRGTGKWMVSLSGVAPKIDGNIKTALGFANTITNNAVMLIEMPKDLSEFDITKFRFNGQALTNDDLLIDGDNVYLIMVLGLKKVNGAITAASNTFTVTYKDISTSFEFNYDGLTLAT